MRILLYNWVPGGSRVTEGGGVALYLSNIAQALLEAGHEVHVLSSGYRYSAFSNSVHVASRRSRSSKLLYLDIINSPVLAPSFFMFGDPNLALDCDEVRGAVDHVLRTHGPYDVFHVQNVEGISFDVLSLGEAHKKTRFILSNHNYHVICQQANLWREDRVRCVDYGHGLHCFNCNVFPVDLTTVVIDRILQFHGLNDLPKRVARWARGALNLLVRLRRLIRHRPAWEAAATRQSVASRIGPADLFRRRRHEAMARVNSSCAAVLSVSGATEEILLRHGLRRDLSRVSYIGTKHHDPSRPLRRKDPSKPLQLAFLGYTRPDKGFHFLASAIEAMPRSLTKRLSLVIAARVSDPEALGRIVACQGKLGMLKIRNGYSQVELPELLSQVDLGLVLPQWDDALPQVAIEFVTHGVPILSTDRGGQQELAALGAFIFRAEDVDEFWIRVQAIVDNPSLLNTFWEVSRPLRTNAQHVEELLSIYRGESVIHSAGNIKDESNLLHTQHLGNGDDHPMERSPNLTGLNESIYP